MSSILIQVSGGDVFQVSPAMLRLSQTLRDIVDAGYDGTIPLEQLETQQLEQAQIFCAELCTERKEEDKQYSRGLLPWEATWIDALPKNLDVFKLLETANFLAIRPLVSVLSIAIARMFMGKTPEEIFQMMDMSREPTSEEREQLEATFTKEK